jgi:negative regulator of genetic competence, sporulation and motility
MVIHTAGERSLALFFENGELGDTELGTENKITRVREIARVAFQKRGIEVKNIEIEEYEGKTGTVVFVYAEESIQTLIFSFERIADAAEAVKCLGPKKPLNSMLYSLSGTYYLTLFVRAGQLVHVENVLGEYGKRIEGGEIFLSHLEEMGQSVIPCKAAQLLKRFW